MQVVGELRERGVQAKLHLLDDSKQMQAIHRATSCASCISQGSPGDWFAHLPQIL